MHILPPKNLLMNRKVIEGEVHHIYQKTKGGAVIFYSLRDYLVFFTIFCTVADKLGVTVLALCPMPDHLHNASRVKSAEQLVKFVQMYTHSFAREWNKSRNRKESLFQQRFGSAPKIGNKIVRTTINYNNNNPVERKICTKAEDYRWNFLRYYKNRHPYSEPLDESTASGKLRGALQEVRALHVQGDWVHYTQLDRWMKGLNSTEVQQLADYIISTWNILDYVGAISYYGSYDAMIRSFHDNTGSEYEIREDSDHYSDAVYADCTRILMQENQIKSVREIPGLPVFRKMELHKLLSTRTTARPKQLNKYLHLGGE
jgi:REP element-mobilizing transposase RayT